MRGVGPRQRGGPDGGRDGGGRGWELLFARFVPSCCRGPLICRLLCTSSSLTRGLGDGGFLL